MIKKYNKPIVFKSLTFSGRSRKKAIVEHNKNFGSKINAFVSLSVPSRKSMDIPVKFAKTYHGSMKDYMKKSNDYEYVLSFDERHKQVNVTIVRDGKRYLPEVTENDEVVGIDVNIKHNLFALSNGKVYDYDHQLVEDYARLKRQTDGLKKLDKDYEVGKKKQRKLKTLKLEMTKRNEQIVADICKELQ